VACSPGPKMVTDCAIKIVEGGCSGVEYKLDIHPPEAEDQLFEKNDARVLLGAKCNLPLNGTELDYTDELMQSGLVLKPTSKDPAAAAALLAPEQNKDRRRPRPEFIKVSRQIAWRRHRQLYYRVYRRPA
jgi:Fe-S cluster assembly iron-binding protein IscA